MSKVDTTLGWKGKGIGKSVCVKELIFLFNTFSLLKNETISLFKLPQ